MRFFRLIDTERAAYPLYQFRARCWRLQKWPLRLDRVTTLKKELGRRYPQKKICEIRERSRKTCDYLRVHAELRAIGVR